MHNAAAALATAKAEALERYAPAAGRELARKQFLKIPDGLGGGEAEEWADKKMVELLPIAVAELEFQLRFGDDEQRAKAASKVLDATGRGKKENGAAAVAPIIMISGSAALPWLQRPVESNIIDVQPTLAKPDGTQ